MVVRTSSKQQRLSSNGDGLGLVPQGCTSGGIQSLQHNHGGAGLGQDKDLEAERGGGERVGNWNRVFGLQWGGKTGGPGGTLPPSSPERKAAQGLPHNYASAYACASNVVRGLDRRCCGTVTACWEKHACKRGETPRPAHTLRRGPVGLWTQALWRGKNRGAENRIFSPSFLFGCSLVGACNAALRQEARRRMSAKVALAIMMDSSRGPVSPSGAH